MENIIRSVVRHFIFVAISFIALYLIILSFGGMLNYFAWGQDGKLVFAFFAHGAAALMHAYFISE